MSQSNPTKSMVRSTGAVLAGLVVIVVLSIATDAAMYALGIFRSEGAPMPDAWWLIPTGYRLAFGVLGCWISARLAPRGPMVHALILGGIGLLAGLAGLVATRGDDALGPTWYAVAVMLRPVPCALLGGWLGRKRA